MRLEARKRNARRAFTLGFLYRRDSIYRMQRSAVLPKGSTPHLGLHMYTGTWQPDVNPIPTNWPDCASLELLMMVVCSVRTCLWGSDAMWIRSWNRPTVLYLLLQVAHRCIRHRSCRLLSDLMSTVTCGNRRQPSGRSHHKILKENNLLSFKSYYYITITSKKFLTFVTLKMCFHSSIVQLSLCVWSQAPTRSFYLHSKHIVQSR